MSKADRGAGGRNFFNERRNAANAALIDTPPPEVAPSTASSGPTPAEVTADSASATDASPQAETPQPRRPGPPPRKEESQQPAWVQLNVRVSPEHARALEKYRLQHGVTKQAVVHQMLGEYFGSRGIKPR